ncbi:hypothetical protein, partial [Methylobrevis pamukkalensis]|uniref:hypothetical protein n=1 Tax=Methylobrevis pamukkalensis TaxID=1439726 RepID=UPI001471C5A4
MAGILDTAKTVYRENVVAGDATSGEHEPVKSAIIALWGQIVAALTTLGLAAAFENVVLYETVSARDADTSQADGTLGIVWLDAPDNGISVWDGADWVDTGLVVPGDLAADIAAVDARVDAVETDVADLVAGTT